VKHDLTIRVCMGTGGIAAGGTEVMDTFKKHLGSKSIKAEIKKNCTMHRVGCRGLCARDVLVDIIVKDVKTTYQFIKPDMVERIVDEHILNGNPVEEWTVSEDYHSFHSKQVKVVLSDCGSVDPEEIESYINVKGYDALKEVVAKMSPVEAIDIIKKSGLRGRGGAGFPTGQKWEEGRRYNSFPKYVICNGDEGDPGAFMDRSVLEADPHSVLEGMAICGYAIDAHQGYVYVRAEYPLAIHRLNIAIEQARNYGLLGKDILGSGFDFDIGIYPGAGAFVCGESTALMYSLEGKRGMPRIKPPRSTEAGLWSQPTVLNNVETLANVPPILLKGGQWFASLGTEGSKGTKVFALTGTVQNVGLIEVPMGTTLRKIVFDIGGGITDKREFKAIQIGGPSGACLPNSLLDLEVDFDSLDDAGAMMGSGGLVAMNDSTCMVDTARFFTDFSVDESCGKCVPCRVGMKVMLNILNRITVGQGTMEDIELLERLGQHIKDSSHCGLGKTAPNPVLSTIRYFRNEYEAHIQEKRCPALVCTSLIKFRVDPEKCKMCGLCKKACPMEAVTWEKKTPAVIDVEKCIRCRSCIQACKFSAIE
jgi:NADH:ubiquinone oxidoreductase subunit F (NADH-binding)/NAD-dependent dihydropyrimidine dehydrogenase PreA subunit/(2Fe-2S) ferredoxin